MDKDQLGQAFREEALELLSELETLLIELEKTPGDAEIVSSIFRAFHTLKGSGAMCGFDEMSQFTHHVETIYNLVRNKKITADKRLIDLTLASCDLIHRMIDSPSSDQKVPVGRGAEILSSFAKLVKGGAGTEQADGHTGLQAPYGDISGRSEKQVTYRIRFCPGPDIFSNGTNPLLLLNELRRMGKAEVIACTDAIPELRDIDPEKCYTFWDIILTTGAGISAVRDVFIFVEHDSEVKIDVIDDGESHFEAEDHSTLGEILVEKGELKKEDLEKVLREKKRIGELLVKEGLVKPISIEAALTEQEQLKQIRENRQKIESMMNIRVSSRKLDKLMNLVGELVTVQARLSQTSSNKSDPELDSIAEEVNRLTGELRETAMDIRMTPIGKTFSTFKRLVRDLSIELGKEVELIATGSETEMDKTVMEKLNDPLVHIIRNSIDHGIELPGERERNGKQRKGTVHLSAMHSGGQVLITIEDDGAGIDLAVVRAKALETGLISPDAELSKKEIFSLIFTPGFTTAAKVTKVSGRGVGMDVVRRTIGALGGTVEIESRKGTGTTIILKLPLTLAIIEGLLVKVGREYFILPLSAVEECVELTAVDIAKAHGRHITNVRSHMVPYIRLREKFIVEGNAPEREQIVIITSEGQRIGFVVDSVVGEHQTVIKSLGTLFRNVEGLSGATILGDGTVALIIDIAKLVKMFEREELMIWA